MRNKIIFLLIISLSITISSTQALSWAYPFVVWNTNVYEVTDDEVIDSLLGKRIGEVKTKPNMRGDYYGNASNVYPKGTRYYEISGVATDISIAVEVKEGQWVKANFTHKAPFHWMNFFMKVFPLLILILIAVIIVKIVKNTRKNV